MRFLFTGLLILSIKASATCVIPYICQKQQREDALAKRTYSGRSEFIQLRDQALKLVDQQMTQANPFGVNLDQPSCFGPNQSFNQYIQTFVSQSFYRGFSRLSLINPRLVLQAIEFVQQSEVKLKCGLFYNSGNSQIDQLTRGVSYQSGELGSVIEVRSLKKILSDQFQLWSRYKKYFYYLNDNLSLYSPFVMRKIHNSAAYYLWAIKDEKNRGIQSSSNIRRILDIQNIMMHEFLHLLQIENKHPIIHNNYSFIPYYFAPHQKEFDDPDVIYSCAELAFSFKYDQSLVENRLESILESCAGAAKINIKDYSWKSSHLKYWTIQHFKSFPTDVQRFIKESFLDQLGRRMRGIFQLSLINDCYEGIAYPECSNVLKIESDIYTLF